MPPVPVLVLAALILAPLGVEAADLVVWGQAGWCPEEGRALAAFEQRISKPVELLQSTTGMFGPGDARTCPLFAICLKPDGTTTSWCSS